MKILDKRASVTVICPDCNSKLELSPDDIRVVVATDSGSFSGWTFYDTFGQHPKVLKSIWTCPVCGHDELKAFWDGCYPKQWTAEALVLSGHSHDKVKAMNEVIIKEHQSKQGQPKSACDPQKRGLLSRLFG